MELPVVSIAGAAVGVEVVGEVLEVSIFEKCIRAKSNRYNWKYKRGEGNFKQTKNMRNYKYLRKPTDFNRKSAAYEKEISFGHRHHHVF